MHRFAARNHQIKYDQKSTYYYWMFDTERKERQKEIREPEIISLGYVQNTNVYEDFHSSIAPLTPKPFWQSLFGGSRETCIS